GSGFAGNVASALLGTDFGIANGGAVEFIADHDDPLSITGSTFTSNVATAPSVGVGLGRAAGGALDIDNASGPIDVTKTHFEDNAVRSTSEQSGASGEGGAIAASGAQLAMRLVSSEVAGSRVIAHGASSFTRGGGLSVHAGDVTVDRSSLTGNHVTARAGL